MLTRPGSSALALAPALVLVVVSLWEVAATWRDTRVVPGDDAWAEAAKVVRAGYQPGDLIVFAPDWVDPVGRLHLGDLIPVDMAARMDAATYGRIWELGIRGARSKDTIGLEAAATTETGGVTVRRFERTPVVVVSDIRDQKPTSDGAVPTLELAEVGFEPHRCLQLTPTPGHPTRVTFAQLPLGTTLVGYVGLADVFTRRDIRAPGTLAVEIAGKTLATVSPGVDDGWRRFAADTTPGPHHLEVVATAVGPKARDRRICFAAEARK